MRVSATSSLLTATRPEDVFGELKGSPDEQLRIARATYRRLARVNHPDVSGSVELMARLNHLWSLCQRDIAAGRYGRTFTLTTRTREYRVGRLVARGDVANVYDAGDHVVKIVRSPTNGELLLNEFRVLRRVRASDGVAPDAHEKLRNFVPEPIETFRHSDVKTGKQRRVIVLKRPDEGFINLARVGHAFPSGINPRDMAWMMRRLLVTLGYAAEAGYVHGAVNPEHVLIHPEKHGLILWDWTLAGTIGAPLRARPTRYSSSMWYPPDEHLDTRVDVYGAQAAMRSVCRDVPRPLNLFFQGMRLSRVPHPWKLREELEELLERMWGPRRFRPFSVPDTAYE